MRYLKIAAVISVSVAVFSAAPSLASAAHADQEYGSSGFGSSGFGSPQDGPNETFGLNVDGWEVRVTNKLSRDLYVKPGPIGNVAFDKPDLKSDGTAFGKGKSSIIFPGPSDIDFYVLTRNYGTNVAFISVSWDLSTANGSLKTQCEIEHPAFHNCQISNNPAQPIQVTIS